MPPKKSKRPKHGIQRRFKKKVLFIQRVPRPAPQKINYMLLLYYPHEIGGTEGNCPETWKKMDRWWKWKNRLRRDILVKMVGDAVLKIETTQKCAIGEELSGQITQTPDDVGDDRLISVDMPCHIEIHFKFRLMGAALTGREFAFVCDHIEVRCKKADE